MLEHGDDFVGEIAVTHATTRLEPCERPVDHAEQHHRERRLVVPGHPIGERSRELACEGGHHIALPVQHDLPLLVVEELHVVEQRDVPRLRRFVLIEESANQLMERVALGETAALAERLDLGDDEHQPLGVALEQIEQNGVLARVVMIEAGLRRAARGGQLGHRGARVARAGERLGRDIENLFALRFVIGRFGTCHKRGLLQS